MFTQKLLRIASSAIAASESFISIDDLTGRATSSANALSDMLREKNGFYAFEGALHVFPSAIEVLPSNQMSIQHWNKYDLWRIDYEGAADDLLFFAEDIFGVQFAIDKSNAVVIFDPEIAEVRLLANNIEEWSKEILQNFDELTGASIAHEWQLQNGKLKAGERVLPKIPFVLGGAFEISILD